MSLCKGVMKKDGQPCRFRAKINGFCMLHQEQNDIPQGGFPEALKAMPGGEAPGAASIAEIYNNIKAMEAQNDEAWKLPMIPIDTAKIHANTRKWWQFWRRK